MVNENAIMFGVVTQVVMVSLFQWLCNGAVESVLLIGEMSRLNLELWPYCKISRKVKYNEFSTVSIFIKGKTLEQL